MTNNIFVPKHITKSAKKLNATSLITASEEWFYYDNVNQPLGYVLNGCLVKKVTKNVKPNLDDDSVTLTYTYDNYGNLLTFKDGRANAGEYATNTTTYAYETNYQAYPVTETNAENHTSSIHYDSLMRSDYVADANGQVWKTGYDAYGRVEKTAAPGDDLLTAPTKTFSYAYATHSIPYNWVDTVVKQNDTNNIYSCAYYDGFGRLIQTLKETEGTDYKWNTVDYYYDSSGRQNKTSVPYLQIFMVFTMRIPVRIAWKIITIRSAG